MKAIKRVPVKFESQEEYIRALMDGRRFCIGAPNGIMEFYYDKDINSCPFKKIWKGHEATFENTSFCAWENHTFKEIIEQRWEASLGTDEYPGGILCVINNDIDSLRRIKMYRSDRNPKYLDIFGLYHENARPATREELEKYLYSTIFI